MYSEERTSELWLEQLHLRSGPLQFMNLLKTCINKSCPGLWKTGLIVTGNSSKELLRHTVSTHTRHEVCVSALLSRLRWDEVILQVEASRLKAGRVVGGLFLKCIPWQAADKLLFLHVYVTNKLYVCLITVFISYAYCFEGTFKCRSVYFTCVA